MNPMRKTKRELVKILRMFEKENQVLKNETVHVFDLTVDTLKTLDRLHRLIEIQKDGNQTMLEQWSAQNNTRNQTTLPDIPPRFDATTQQEEKEKSNETISGLERLVEELSSVIQKLSEENEQLKADVDHFQCKKKRLEDEIQRRTHQVKKLIKENDKLEANQQIHRDQMRFYNEIFQNDEKRFVLINEELEIELVSNCLKKQMAQGSSWNEKSLHKLITGERSEKKGKIIKKIQSVLEGKKNQTLKSIYLKLSPLKIIKTNAKAVRTSIRERPAVLLSF